MSEQLRDYQLSGIDAARQLFRRGHRSVLLQAPCGSGKTSLAAGMISMAVKKGSRVLFIANRRELISQPFARFQAYGLTSSDMNVIMGSGRIQGPYGNQFDARRPGAPVSIATIQSLSRRALPPADLLFLDEARHACSTGYKRVIKHYLDSGARVTGLDATPCRSDGKGLAEVFTALHSFATFRELADMGYLCVPSTYSGPEVDVSGVPIGRDGDYEPVALEAVCDTTKFVGSVTDQWFKLAEGRSTVVFASGVEASKHIRDAFVAAGVRAEHVDGGTNHIERDAIFARVRAGTTTVLTNCDVCSSGWDEPRVKVCVLARPTRSLAAYLQKAGRCLRPWGGVEAAILDHTGAHRQFGLVQDDRQWALENDRKRGGESPKKQCPECGIRVATAVRVCPSCGYQWPAPEGYEVVAGDLVKVTDPHEWPADTRKRFYRECLIKSAIRGYKVGYARHTYKLKCGEWPRWYALEKEFYSL